MSSFYRHLTYYSYVKEFKKIPSWCIYNLLVCLKTCTRFCWSHQNNVFKINYGNKNFRNFMHLKGFTTCFTSIVLTSYETYWKQLVIMTNSNNKNWPFINSFWTEFNTKFSNSYLASLEKTINYTTRTKTFILSRLNNSYL